VPIMAFLTLLAGIYTDCVLRQNAAFLIALNANNTSRTSQDVLFSSLIKKRQNVKTQIAVSVNPASRRYYRNPNILADLSCVDYTAYFNWYIVFSSYHSKTIYWGIVFRQCYTICFAHIFHVRGNVWFHSIAIFFYSERIWAKQIL